MSTEEHLTQFLKESADWERRPTNILGIFLLKLPGSKIGTRKESIAIGINPVNQATGYPTKKRGIVLRSASELETISTILSKPKLTVLANKTDNVNLVEMKSKAKRSAADSDIIEI
jgi:hypothetical protein